MIPRNTTSVQNEHCGNPPDKAHACVPIRLWLVDDSNSFRVLLIQLLGDEGDFVCERDYDSAEAVLEALTHYRPPDVILLDIDMGGMSGLEAVHPIKSLAAETRVVMLTAFSDSDRRTRALRDGASDFLLKGYGVEEIASRIRKVMELDCRSGGGESGRTCSSVRPQWPSRRAPAIRGDPSNNNHEEPRFPEHGPGNLSWRRWSGRLARGVTYVRAWLRSPHF